MKKITLVLIAALICSFSFAQKQYQENTKVYPISKNQTLTNASKAQTLVYNYANLLTDIETLFTEQAFTNTSLATYVINGQWGYMAGHNGYGDTKKAEKMSFSAPGTLDSVLFLGYIGLNSGTSTFDLIVWQDNAGVPGTAVSTTPVQVNTLTTTTGYNLYTIHLNTPLNITAGTYYVGFEYNYNAGFDTLAIVSTEDGTTANFAFEEYDGTWSSFTDNWGADISLSIISCVTYEESAPVILANPNSLNFYGSQTLQSTITTSNLTEDITATTVTPYEISIDNTTFGTTATVPQAGGTLYVRYTSTSITTQETGTVTLTSGTTTATIALSGIGSSNCDIAVAFLSNSIENGGVEISDTTISSADDLWIFPQITNNGPDACNTSAQISITANGNSLISQSMDFTGLPANNPIVLANTGEDGISLSGIKFRSTW